MADNEKNKERLKEITDSIEQGIRELFQSDRYMQYLQTMSRFHRYSVNNTMLIYMQKPDATLVAGFNKWHDQFSRNVMNLICRNGNMVEPGFARHQAVAVLVIDRQTTVVIMVDVPFAPVGFGMSQQFIHLLGGGAASQHDGKTAARGNRFPRCIEDALEGGQVDGILTVERMPAGNLLITAGDLA